jgi:hypothetical protein
MHAAILGIGKYSLPEVEYIVVINEFAETCNGLKKNINPAAMKNPI